MPLSVTCAFSPVDEGDMPAAPVVNRDVASTTATPGPRRAAWPGGPWPGGPWPSVPERPATGCRSCDHSPAAYGERA
ncbi:hypothetical protein ACFQX6_61570 [Streptosporangium lutulentum]